MERKIFDELDSGTWTCQRAEDEGIIGKYDCCSSCHEDANEGYCELPWDYLCCSASEAVEKYLREKV